MKTAQNIYRGLGEISEVIGIIEESLKRIRLRGKYPLQTELDLIGIAYEVGQIKNMLREINNSSPVN